MEASDQPEDPQTENVPAEDTDAMDAPDEEPYPPDDTGGDLFSDVVGTNTPIPRAQAIRQAALQRRPPQNKKTAKRVKKNSSRILAKQKQRQALELRKAGVTYEDIAQRLGYKDHSGARKAVTRAFNSIHQEPVAELKMIQIERLNHMLVPLWGRVQQGDESAMRTALQIMDRIDRLHDMGSEGGGTTVNINNQHTANSVLVIDGNKDDYITALKKMAGVMAPDGSNVLPAGDAVVGRQAPPGMTLDSTHPDIVEAELVEALPDDPDQPERDGSGPEYVRTDEGPAPTPARKTYSFGVDPTVKKGTGDAGTDQGAGPGPEAGDQG